MDSRIRVVFLLFYVACAAWPEYAFNCTAAGRFANTTDPDCRSYVHCVYIPATGLFQARSYQCPSRTVFNPKLNQCTDYENYTCKLAAHKTNCEQEGFMRDDSSLDCTTFIACVSIGDVITQKQYRCPIGTFFDPIIGDCTFEYECGGCTEPGRFPNKADPTCSSFFSCIQAPDGAYVKTTYNCPPPSLFNPSTKLCSKYTC